MKAIELLIQILCLSLTTVATIVLAILTRKYVRLTHSMLEEARTQKEPNVYVDLELSSYQAKLLIGNSGRSPAVNLRFEVKDNIPWRISEHYPSLSQMSVVRNGISYLAPFRTLKYIAGYIDDKKTFSELNSSVEIRLAYETEDGKEVKRDFVIDIGQYREVLFESFTNPADKIASAIKGVEAAQKSSIRDRPISLLFKKPCPICHELISSGAKKCPHCHEFVNEQDAGREKNVSK